MRCIFGYVLLTLAVYAVSVGVVNATRLPFLQPTFDNVKSKVKWGPGNIGTPVVVTYGFVTEPDIFDDGILKEAGCRNLVSLAESLPGVTQEELDSVAAYAFGEWSALSGLQFKRAVPGERPDVLLGAQAEPSGVAWTDLRLKKGRAGRGFHQITAGVICFSPKPKMNGWSEAGVWRVAKNGEVLEPKEDLEYALLHEVGHVLGVGHPSSKKNVMGFTMTGIRTITEILAGVAISLYGPRVLPQS